jgi:PKD repeat protein
MSNKFKLDPMKKNRTIPFSLVALVIVALTMASCKEEPVMPTPDFTFVISDKTVTFTNTSTDADSYSWDFGDETTSTEVNPVHTYAAYGDYDVRLTAINSDGEKINKQTLSVVKVWPAITIDGDFSDWDAVEPLYSGYGDASGTLTEAKVTTDAAGSKLYIYVKGTINSAYPVIQIMINADGNTATGWDIPDYASNGADYQFEYYALDEWGGAYSWNPDPGVQDWPWDIDITADPENGDITESSGVINESEIEFVIETSLMKNPVVADQIGIYFWAQPEDWSETCGALPPLYAEPLEDVKFFSFQ